MVQIGDVVNNTVAGEWTTWVRAIGAQAREQRTFGDVVLQLRRATSGVGKQSGYVYFSDDVGSSNAAVDRLVNDVGVMARSRVGGARGTP